MIYDLPITKEDYKAFNTAFYTAVFNGTSARDATFNAVWKYLEDTIKDNPGITVTNLNAEKGTVTLSTERGELSITPSRKRNKTFDVIYTSKHDEADNNTQELASTPTMADALLEYLVNSPKKQQSSSKQRLDIH